MFLPSALEALKRGDYAAARAVFAQADNAALDERALHVKGLAEIGASDWAAVLATFAEAVARFPDRAVFWLNKGMAEENLTRWPDAVASYEKCLSLNPAQAEACGNLANLYRQGKDLPRAERMARQALALGADRGAALNSLGLTLNRQGRFIEAEAAFCAAQKAAPDNPDILANRANLAVDQLDFDKAWPLFAQAREMQDKPAFRRDEGMARLLAGDYARGWELYEARLEMPGALRILPPCPRWRGEDLTGKRLLIVAEQGFGDVILFARYQGYLPDCDLVWTVPHPLISLLTRFVRGTVTCETSHIPSCDFYVPLMSLPWAFKQYTPAPPLPFKPRLAAPEEDAKEALPRRRKIGLVWRGSPTHERDAERSIPLRLLMNALEGYAADFYAVFKGAGLDEAASYPVQRLDHLMTDFADTADIVASMDCVIAVDTAVAHLAGTLGVPTYILLPYCPDWRWGLSGAATSWYPGVTLLRQEEHGDWDGVLEKLRNALFPAPRSPFPAY